VVGARSDGHHRRGGASSEQVSLSEHLRRQVGAGSGGGTAYTPSCRNQNLPQKRVIIIDAAAGAVRSAILQCPSLLCLGLLRTEVAVLLSLCCWTGGAAQRRFHSHTPLPLSLGLGPLEGWQRRRRGTPELHEHQGRQPHSLSLEHPHAGRAKAAGLVVGLPLLSVAAANIAVEDVGINCFGGSEASSSAAVVACRSNTGTPARKSAAAARIGALPAGPAQVPLEVVQ
jgi:hypothetical protein